MNRSRAFTLVEFLVVLTIIAVIVALVFPVFQSAKRSAKVARTMSASHQLWLALSLYRSDWDGEGKIGTASEMGLPPFGPQIRNVATPELWLQTCSPNQGFTYWPTNDGGPDSWQEYVTIAGEGVPIVSTTSCTPSEWDVDNQFHPKLGIAATIGGTVIKRNRAGSTGRLAWWTD